MDKFEKLIATIMKEAEADGEPVTYEEAKEMAEMEMNAPKRYEHEEKPRKKAEKVRKVDEEKKEILSGLRIYIEGKGAENITVKTETEVSFTLNGSAYTLKLTKHRPPKN